MDAMSPGIRERKESKMPKEVFLSLAYIINVAI
jgi:hypothetical protein